MIDHAFLLIPAQKIVGDFLMTFREFPPRQKAASFTVDQVMEKLLAGYPRLNDAWQQVIRAIRRSGGRSGLLQSSISARWREDVQVSASG